MKKVLIPAAVIAVILSVAFVVYKFVFHREVFTVQAVAGVVEIESGGMWIPVVPGTRISPGAKIRTSRGGKVVLVSAKGVKVEVKENSVVQVEGIKEDILNITLDLGEISADVGKGPVKKIVMNTGAGTVEVNAGSVIVASDGRKTLSFYSPAENAVVKVEGREVSVGADEKVIIAEGGREIRVKKDSPLNLEVEWPPSPTRLREVEIRGKTEPGAGVIIGDVFTYADDEGRFSVRLKLQEGENQIVAIARDVLGREKVEVHTIVVDTTPPEVRLKNRLRWE